MKKYIGIFAHPDDEAFGPGGSFLLWKEGSARTYVLTATQGELGGKKGIENVRRQEMMESGKRLKLDGHHFLGFIDGDLRNSIYDDIVKSAVSVLSDIIEPNDDVTFVTFERGGISGHLDHIAMSMIASHIYAHRVEWLPKMSSCELLYYCIPHSRRPKARTDYFVFTPPGTADDEITLTQDVSALLDQKKQAILAHKSQYPEKFLESVGDEMISTECFVRCNDID